MRIVLSLSVQEVYFSRIVPIVQNNFLWGMSKFLEVTTGFLSDQGKIRDFEIVCTKPNTVYTLFSVFRVRKKK